MRKQVLFLCILAAACMQARAAFEPVPASPWLQSGVASGLFPLSPLVLSVNPACIGLMEEAGVAASACRPFGLRRLDRTAVAACLPMKGWTGGAAMSLSGDGSYTEASFDAALSWKVLRGLAAGTGVSVMRLQISGYGRATGASLTASVVWTPAAGVYSTALFRGVMRTGLGASGDPAGPRSLELAVGVVPVDDIRVAAGAARQEGLDMEYGFHTAFSPSPFLDIGTGIRTDPLRFWVAVGVSVSTAGLQYGYGEHSSLPGTHSIALSWGRSAFIPEPLSRASGPGETLEPSFPLNVNTASEEELRQIPGIGPSKASALVSWVRANGPLTSVDALSDVPGIGPSILSVLREYLVAE